MFFKKMENAWKHAYEEAVHQLGNICPDSNSYRLISTMTYISMGRDNELELELVGVVTDRLQPVFTHTPTAKILTWCNYGDWE